MFYKELALATRGQRVLPDRSISIGQKMAENARIENFKWYIGGNFPTMYIRLCQNILTDFQFRYFPVHKCW